MELGLHGIRTTIFEKRFYTFLYYIYIMFVFIFYLFMYFLFYIVYVTSYSFTSIWDGTSGMERLCEIVKGL